MAKKSVKAKSTKKKPPEKETERSKLEKELKGLLKKVDEGGLIFLLKQARVMIHNLEVDKINKEIAEYEKNRKNRLSEEPGEAGSKKKTSGKRRTPASGKKSVKAAAVSIEEINNGKSFFIELKNARKIFSLDEMRSLVKICHGAVNVIEAGSNLNRWLLRNRKDVIADCGLAGTGDPYLALLYTTIMKTYKVKGS